jgi:translation initiation factor IF-2
MRVHEIAKKHKLTSDEMLALLKKAGFAVKSHMSSMSDEMLGAVEKHLKSSKPKPAAKAKPAAKPKVAAKAKVKKKTAEPAKTAARPKAKVKTAPKTAAPKSVKPQQIKDAVQASARETIRQAKKKAASPGKKPQVERPTTPPGAGKPKPVRKVRSAAEAQQKAVRESVRRTLAKIEATRRTKRRKSKPRLDVATQARVARVPEGATVRELAGAFKVDAQEILQRCGDLEITATINQTLDKDAVELLAEDLGVNVHFVTEELEELLQTETKVEPSRMTTRAPIVTVMGHVDHGKTSILDHIRKTRVASGEAGGITQHIGAYEVEHGGGRITFIDTPGHEAFTSMRARGAQVTDIVVLVVAADDGVMPQTIEAINHAKAAGVPLIVAVNKIDLAGANAAQIKQQLTEHDVVVEEFGGDAVCVEVSAKTGAGIDKLLEMILLQAELLELQADTEASAQAIAIEVKKEEGRASRSSRAPPQRGEAFDTGSGARLQRYARTGRPARRRARRARGSGTQRSAAAEPQGP